MASDPSQILPDDPCIDLAPRDVQQQAARLVQEAFAAAVRLTVQTEGKQLDEAVSRLADHLREWSRMAVPESAQFRLAMILAGMDQWGLAYSQAFGADLLGCVSSVLANLRDCLDLSEESACQVFLDRIHDEEACALEFKICFRRDLHLALWHSLIEAEDRAQAEALLKLLGGLLLALNRAMPTLGWRLVADTFASIQIRCLQHGLAGEGLGREMTESLFEGVHGELPESVRDLVTAHSASAVHAWREASRATQH